MNKVSCDFIPAKFLRGMPRLIRGRIRWEGRALCRLLSSQFVWERVLVEGAELAFFDVDAPAPPDNAQTGHHRDGEIDAEYSGDFAARENAEQGRQRMQLHTDAHDAGRDYVIQHDSPD